MMDTWSAKLFIRPGSVLHMTAIKEGRTEVARTKVLTVEKAEEWFIEHDCSATVQVEDAQPQCYICRRFRASRLRTMDWKNSFTCLRMGGWTKHHEPITS